MQSLQTANAWCGALSGIFFVGSAWKLSFKYWQTANEIEFLFLIANPRRDERQRRLYLALNLVGYFFAAGPYLGYALLMTYRATHPFDFWNTLIVECVVFGYFYTGGFFVAAVLKIKKQVRSIPHLKESLTYFERVRKLFLAVLANLVCVVVWTLLHPTLKGKLSARSQLTVYFVLLFCNVLLTEVTMVLICLNAWNYHKPALAKGGARSDTAAMAKIKSKCEQQKIFPDSDLADSRDQPQNSRDEAQPVNASVKLSGAYEELCVPTVLGSSVESWQDREEFYLRQQILGQMFVFDDADSDEDL